MPKTYFGNMGVTHPDILILKNLLMSENETNFRQLHG